jgi:hypothetical protein
MTPFGLIPASLMGQPASHIVTEEGIIPTPDLVASQVVTETIISPTPEQSQTPILEGDNENAEGNQAVDEENQLEMTDVTLDEETRENNPSTDDSTPTAESPTESIVPQPDLSATAESSPESSSP